MQTRRIKYQDHHLLKFIVFSRLNVCPTARIHPKMSPTRPMNVCLHIHKRERETFIHSKRRNQEHLLLENIFAH